MASEFQTYGRDLLAAGYLIVPIAPGKKRPPFKGWQNARLGIDDLDQYARCGVGILCGQGANPIAALDVDTTHAALASAFSTWCLETFGLAPERVGAAPKTLLVYRAAEPGWVKTTSPWMVDAAGDRHRLEVLGHGQQFVAYHTHPDTRQPYRWVDLIGGLEMYRADDLVTLTQDQIAAAIETFQQLAESYGLQVKPGGNRSPQRSMPDADDPLMSYEPPIGLDVAEAERLLAFVDNEDYDLWLKVGMSLHHEYEGSADGLELWDRWSESASNYVSREDLDARWEGFGRTGRTPITARWILKIGRANETEAHQRAKRGVRDEARTAVEECDDSVALVDIVAPKVGALIGSDLGLKAEIAGLIRAQFKKLTGASLPAATTKAAMEQARPNDDQSGKRPRTEMDIANRFLDTYGDSVLYAHDLGYWLCWNGVHWEVSSDHAVRYLVQQTIIALPNESANIADDGERMEYLKFCANCQTYRTANAVFGLVQNNPRILTSAKQLDQDPNLLGVANGTVDLRTGKLLAPDPDHRITISTPVAFNPDAGCPVFLDTVADVFFGDLDMIGFFHRLLGYAVRRQPTEDVIAIPYGDGSNGKSTLMMAIRNALGSHSRMCDSETLLTCASASSAGGAREDILRLRGARLVYATELDEGAVLKEGLVKSMTGGEAIPARGLYAKVTVEVQPDWVVFMPTNHKPTVKGDDVGIWRRLMPVPFTRNFEEDLTVKKDVGRAEKLAAEAEGILAWLVRGVAEYHKQGLRPPESVDAAGNAYKGEMDLLAEWLAECCEIGPDLTASNAQLWASWESFSRGRGENRLVPSMRSLGRRLAKRNFKLMRSSAMRGFSGLRVRSVGGFEDLV